MFIIFIEPRAPDKRLVPYRLKLKDECLADRVCILFRRKGYNSWVEFF